MADAFILHQYDTSPFSEKPRLMFGLKGLAWRAVIQPSIMPKPDLIPLTGGYRRAPVMQIGADIFCDSQVILAEIERRSPSPTPSGALDWAVNLWADRLFFQASVAVIFGELGETVPRAFIEDREKLSGRPFDLDADEGGRRPDARPVAGPRGLDRTGPFRGRPVPGRKERQPRRYRRLYEHPGSWADFRPRIWPAPMLAGLDRLSRPGARGWRRSATGRARSEMTAARRPWTWRGPPEPANFTEHDDADPLGLAPGWPRWW